MTSKKEVELEKTSKTAENHVLGNGLQKISENKTASKGIKESKTENSGSKNKGTISTSCLSVLPVLSDLNVLNNIINNNNKEKDIKDNKDIKDTKTLHPQVPQFNQNNAKMDSDGNSHQKKTEGQTEKENQNEPENKKEERKDKINHTQYKDLFKIVGNKEYILWYLYDKTSSVSEIDIKLDLSTNTTQKAIERNEQFFELDHKELNKKFWKLSEKGKRFVENTIKEHLERNNKINEESKNKGIDIVDAVTDFISSLSDNKRSEFSDVFPGSYVKIDFKDLMESNLELADGILDDPSYTMKCLNVALKHDLNTDKGIMLINLPEVSSKNIGDIRTKDKGNLIVIEGNIILKSKTEPIELISKFECPTCCNIITIVQSDNMMKEPSRCSCGRKGHFKKLSSEDTDEQKLIIEEPYDQVNRDVENINVIMQGYLTSPEFEMIKNIGERIKISGYIDTEPVYTKNGLSTHKKKFMKALGLEHADNGTSDIVITDDDMKRIKDFARNNSNVARSLGEMTFANIFGHNEIKEAIILQQIGGVRKVLPDKTVRGDIHILLIGDPGTGKSDLLGGVKKIAPKVRSISGAGASKVGLIGTVKFNDFFNSWTVEGGALAKANKGIVLADEFDKMTDDDRAGLHEAMEQQCCTIDKASIHATMITQTSLLASANPKHSGWDIYGDLLDQFNLPRSLQGRFDLMFPVKDIPDKVRDIRIAKTMLDPKVEAIDFDFIKKYIIYAKKIVPVMSKAVKDKIVSVYSSLRSLPDSKHRRFITARDINAIIRLSEAFAKSRLSDSISVADVDRAVALHKFCLSELKYIEDDYKQSEMRVKR